MTTYIYILTETKYTYYGPRPNQASICPLRDFLTGWAVGTGGNIRLDDTGPAPWSSEGAVGTGGNRLDDTGPAPWPSEVEGDTDSSSEKINIDI